MSSLIEQLVGTQQTAAEQVQADSAAQLAASETEIQQNAIYKAIHGDTEELNKINEIAEFLTLDESLTKEENAEKIAALANLNRYYQDQMIQLAQRLTDFSNDQALSMYDKVVEKLQGRLGNFSGAIRPLVHALKVIKQAEDEGKNPQDLLHEVASMRKKREALEKEMVSLAEKAQIQEEEVQAEANNAERSRNNLQNGRRELEALERDLSEMRVKLVSAKSGFLSSLFNASEIESLEAMIIRQETQVSFQKKSNAKAKENLARFTETLKQAEEDFEAVCKIKDEANTELQKIVAELEQDMANSALSKLIEITGEEYKDKRGNLVDNAKAFIEESIAEFNSCIGRFESLETEINDFSHVAENLINNYSVLIKGADQAYESTNGSLATHETNTAELTEKEKENGTKSLELERLVNQVRDYKDYLNSFLPNRDSAINFRRILTERESEFTGLRGLVQGKRHDAEELRTNGAVAVASQLVMTLKSLESAVASQKTEVLRSMLGEFSSVANAATEDVLGRLITDQDKRNSRLVDSLQGLVSMKDKIDKATDEILARRTDEAGLTEAVIEATDRVKDSSDDLKNTVVEARRMGKETVGKDEAAAIVDKMEDNIANG